MSSVLYKQTKILINGAKDKAESIYARKFYQSCVHKSDVSLTLLKKAAKLAANETGNTFVIQLTVHPNSELDTCEVSRHAVFTDTTKFAFKNNAEANTAATAFRNQYPDHTKVGDIEVHATDGICAVHPEHFEQFRTLTMFLAKHYVIDEVEVV